MQRLHPDTAGFKNKGMCDNKHIPYSVTQVNETCELLYKKSVKGIQVITCLLYEIRHFLKVLICRSSDMKKAAELTHGLRQALQANLKSFINIRLNISE